MFSLLLAEMRRSTTIFLRYPLEAVTSIVTITAIFFALFIGAHYIAGPGAQFGNRLEGVIVSYLLWSLTIFALGDMGWTIQMDAMTGTLEQVYLSPAGPVRVLICRAVSDIFVQICITGVVFFVIKGVTHQHLRLTPEILPPLVVVILGTYGLGFILAGLTLVFKRIQNVLQLSQFAVLFMVAVPVEGWTGDMRVAGFFIPLAPGAGMIREIMSRDLPFNPHTFLAALCNGVGYFLIGVLLFKIADRVAKRRGLLGGY